MSTPKKKKIVKKVATGPIKKIHVANVNTHEFRLLDFAFCDSKPSTDRNGDSDDNNEGGDDDDDDDDGGYNEDDNDFTNEGSQQYTPELGKDDKYFLIQIFGINEKGETSCIFVEDYQPFFFIKVEDDWTVRTKEKFIIHLKNKISQSMPNKEYYHDSITESKLIKRNELYGFDGGKLHKFVQVKFKNVAVMNKVKNLFFYMPADSNERRLSKHGYNYGKYRLFIYEAQIPPLLRYFHLNEISPSGWVTIKNPELCIVPDSMKKTTCTYEYIVPCDDVIPLNEKETQVPYKICSFDIEASSSHGDFPVPVKTYKKLAITLLEYYDSETADNNEVTMTKLKKVIKTAFQFDDLNGIEVVYPKRRPTIKQLNDMIEKWIKPNITIIIENGECKLVNSSSHSIEDMFMQMNENINNTQEDENEMDNDDHDGMSRKASTMKRDNLRKMKKTSDGEDIETMDPHELLHNINIKRETKMDLLSQHFADSGFPELEGDKVTFIGSTFLKYGDSAPYLNNCLVLNTCDPLDNVANSEIETYTTEKQLLLAWTRLIARENPDIIVGYNIFGFDYAFMFQRSLQNKCAESFLQLSRNKDELCGKWVDGEKGKGKGKNQKVLTIEESSTKVASGEYNLHFVKMTGRLQVDLYNHFRKNENLTSYKLDYVSGFFIGDNVKSFEYIDKDDITRVITKNLTGLEVGNFINFEEISHSTDTYKEGKKFEVIYIQKENSSFDIRGKEEPNMKKQVRWGLAKDDVTPQDIFRLTNEGPTERAIIAKYCIQDCNLVHHLTNKIDAITGFIEMSKICSVPINFLVMRGQGIKLTSYIAKKCREKNALMPVLEKPEFDDGYEGAIVLDPKCNLYLDNPVACVDYSSLYPSSMISENLSHDSKVWTKEYDLHGNLLKTTGEYDKVKGGFTYDNLPEYEYVDIEYDTFRWEKNQRGKSEKLLSGTKLCRFAQFPDGKKAIMPSILEELLSSRKATRKMIPLQTDEFMKNVLDKRQLSYKLTANSLYGQCGAKTSTFYEKDVAASTTATGRKLLTYGKRVIEESYGDIVVDTHCHGKVHSNAEYVYGDTDSVFFTFNLKTLDGEDIRGQKALDITIELAQEAGELATMFLKKPHDLEYEKTFMPFCLLSKKRYVGMLYELDPTKGTRKSMGIVLKRRDNAPIVKDVYGGIIDILMKEKDVEKAIEFLHSCLQNIIDEKYPLDKLIITKSLRSDYKNPKQIAHKVLADRMGKRDSGNKPSSGDRIPFVYIENKNKKALQGEKIEHPSYIIQNKIRPNYAFYITNQIMKPVQQVFALVLMDIQSFQRKKNNFTMKLETLKNTMRDEPVKLANKITDLKNKEVKTLLFDQYLRETENTKQQLRSITNFFTKM